MDPEKILNKLECIKCKHKWSVIVIRNIDQKYNKYLPEGAAINAPAECPKCKSFWFKRTNWEKIGRPELNAIN